MPAPVVVVTGPPGAGKSTVSRLVVQRYAPSALVAGDDFFAFLRAGRIDPWLPESHAQNDVVVEAAAAAAGRLATGGITVVYDGVIGPWFRDTFCAATGMASMHYAVLTRPRGPSARGRPRRSKTAPSCCSSSVVDRPGSRRTQPTSRH